MCTRLNHRKKPGMVVQHLYKRIWYGDLPGFSKKKEKDIKKERKRKT